MPTTRDELISAGYTTKGVSPCQKCQQQVENLESPAGKVVALNLDTQEDRGGFLHQFFCGKADAQKEFEKLAPSEKV